AEVDRSRGVVVLHLSTLRSASRVGNSRKESTRKINCLKRIYQGMPGHTVIPHPGARMSIQTTIEAAASALPPSLARIASIVRENPSLVVDMTINELAEKCSTSVASVVRFCRSIGFSGYAPLRMALATELGKEAAQVSARGPLGSEISDEGSLREAVSKLAALELLAIEETVEQLDFDALEAAITDIDRAERILLYGIGASQFVAEDLAHKLLRVGRNAHVLTDPHEAIAATVLHSGPTVAIGF